MDAFFPYVLLLHPVASLAPDTYRQASYRALADGVSPCALLLRRVVLVVLDIYQLACLVRIQAGTWALV
ncbi:MAG: hypothetical protein ACKOKF_03995 [Bacteroidota bacterium]